MQSTTMYEVVLYLYVLVFHDIMIVEGLAYSLTGLVKHASLRSTCILFSVHPVGGDVFYQCVLWRLAKIRENSRRRIMMIS